MKKNFVYTLLVAAVLCSMPALLTAEPEAQADTVDMKALKCSAVLEMDEDGAAFMLIWIDGYLSGVTGDTRMNPNGFEAFAEKMASACGKSPDANVLDIAKVVGIN